MLEIQSVSWRNFMSYGDYTTTLDISNLGQCLITGEVVDGETDDSAPISRSNGAGKSTIPSVIQWALFGRTMHCSSPGSKVVNHFTKKDCWAKIEFKNGDSITRTRNLNGTNELLYVKDGNENKLVADTVSTTTNQQKQLNSAFDLDWELFCGSVFFNQFSRSWMEMPAQARKKAIERALHIDRFEYYAKAAKKRLETVDKALESNSLKRQNVEAEVNRLSSSIERLKQSAANFDDNRLQRQQQLQSRIESLQAELEQTQLPDLEKLQQRWSVVEKINQKLDELRRKLNGISRRIAEQEGTKKSLDDKIRRWKQSSGKICATCEQEIDSDHVSSKIEPIQNQLVECEQQVSQVQQEQQKLTATIRSTEQVLAQKQPSLSMRDARSMHSSCNSKSEEIGRMRQQISDIGAEDNPHSDSIAEAQQALADNRKKLEDFGTEDEKHQYLARHYRYIYKAYNDRTKIKSYVFQEHIPFINNRIKHYLGVFDLDVNVELTPALGITSNLWGYEFESGGERKRTDVAFMLAMFDFHEQMYGRQCNVLVLDEVDGRLDDDGIGSLINIIKEDLQSKVEATLIISHRGSMWDVFSSQILVKRKHRFSHIESVMA